MNITFFFSLGPHLQYMEVSRLGNERELQLPAYITATAMRDPSYVCDVYHSSWQHRSPPHWARPGIEPTLPRTRVGFVTHTPTDTSRIRFHCATTRTHQVGFYLHLCITGCQSNESLKKGDQSLDFHRWKLVSSCLCSKPCEATIWRTIESTWGNIQIHQKLERMCLAMRKVTRKQRSCLVLEKYEYLCPS